MEDRNVQEYYGAFLLYAQKAKNFTRQNHGLLLLLEQVEKRLAAHSDLQLLPPLLRLRF